MARGQRSSKNYHFVLISCLLSFFSCQAYAFDTLDFLYQIKGQQTIGGMHNRQPNADPNRYSRQLRMMTGNWPGLYSTDFQFEPKEIANRQRITDQVINEWQNGAMINLMWHACNPAKQSPCHWDSEGVLSEMSDEEWQELITDGTPINNQWTAMLDEIAVFLQQMQDAGAEVMFRPLHEMNQGAFWWGGRPGVQGTSRLFQITHHYLTEVKGLTNIIWVWNLQDFATLSLDLQDYDPGSQYWDVLTMDMYWSDGTGYTQEKYQAILAKAAGKPIGIGECQTLPSVAELTNQPEWTFFMPWSELTFKHNSSRKITRLYDSERVIVLDEMPGW